MNFPVPLHLAHLPLAQTPGGSTLWIVLLVLGIGALILGIARMRHVLARNRLQARFEQFKEKVMQLRQQVEGIKERHKLLTVTDKDYRAPMAGTTLAVYQQLEQDFRHLSDDWLRRMDLWEKVQKLAESETPLGAARFNQAERLLNELGSFDEVDEGCQTCVKQMDLLESGHEHAQTQLTRAEERTGQLRQHVGSIRVLNLPTQPYESELQSCSPLIEQARRVLSADPLGAGDTLGQCHQKMDALNEWIEDIVRLFHRAGKARQELDHVKREAASRRAGGLLLTEPEGNPDPLLAQGDAAHAQSLQSVRAAENKPAKQQLDKVFDLAKQATDVIERQAAARSRCAQELPARSEQAQRLRQALAEAERQWHELERFAPESWEEVADHVARVSELQRASESQLREAVSAAADSRQHYFQAGSLLEQVQGQQEKARDLAQAVGQRLQSLAEARSQCHRGWQELAELARRAQSYLASNQNAVRQATRSRFDAAERSWQQVRGQMDAARPNWLIARQQLDEARKTYAAAMKKAEEDIRDYQKLTTRFAEVEREAERVSLFLRQHHEDRAPANQSYRTAIDRLNRLRQQSTNWATDWQQLLDQVEETAKELKKTEELARQDLQLADRAEAEIASAGRELDRAQGYREDGVTADVGRAFGFLDQARRHLAAKEYERAIDQASAAQKAARNAHEEALRRVHQERQRREEEQRRRNLAGGASSSAAAAGISGLASRFSSDFSAEPSAESPSGQPTEPGSTEEAAPGRLEKEWSDG